MNTITLEIDEKKMALVLVGDEKEVCRVAWVDDNSLLEDFFGHLSALLESNSLSMGEIAHFELSEELSTDKTGYTTLRIAKTIINTLEFTRKSHK